VIDKFCSHRTVRKPSRLSFQRGVEGVDVCQWLDEKINDIQNKEKGDRLDETFSFAGDVLLGEKTRLEKQKQKALQELVIKMGKGVDGFFEKYSKGIFISIKSFFAAGMAKFSLQHFAAGQAPAFTLPFICIYGHLVYQPFSTFLNRGR
jgi:hypothetical protein